MEPMRASSPRNLAPLKLAILIAFQRREAGFDQQLDLAQVAEASHHAAVACRIEAGY